MSTSGSRRSERVRAARGDYTSAFYDALQNATAAPFDQPLIEFGLLCRVAEELKEKGGLIEGDPSSLSKGGQKTYGELREVYQLATAVFDGRDGMRQHLRVVAWGALAQIGDLSKTSEKLRDAAENEDVKADPETARNAGDYLGQPLADFIGDCLNVSAQMEDWERVVRRRPRRGDVLARLRGSYIPPAERSDQPPQPPEPDAPDSYGQGDQDEHPHIG